MGQENLTELTIDDFEVVTMDDRKKYVTKCTSEKTKNHQGETSETEVEKCWQQEHLFVQLSYMKNI